MRLVWRSTYEAMRVRAEVAERDVELWRSRAETRLEEIVRLQSLLAEQADRPPPAPDEPAERAPHLPKPVVQAIAQRSGRGNVNLRAELESFARSQLGADAGPDEVAAMILDGASDFDL